MTSEPQRCGAPIDTGQKFFGGATVWTDCNLPIEGYGPCADVIDGAVCGNDPDTYQHRDNRTPHHPYQPSQWRHFPVYGIVPHGGVDHGHEAKPND